MMNSRFLNKSLGKSTLPFLTLAVALTSCGQGLKDNTKNKPNILFIFADDWGFGDLGCYGHTEAITPNLDKLATQGTRFTQFHVTSPVCSPSRASVITGHFPARHEIHGHFGGNEVNERRGMPNWLNDNLEHYLPRLMQKAGYLTAHYGKWHLGGGGLPHGDLSAPEPSHYGYHDTRVWNGNGPTWKGDQLWPETRYMDDDTLWAQSSSKIAVDAAIQFINENRGKGKPFFINLWLKDPHTPLWPSEEQKEPWQHIDEPVRTYYAVISDADYHIGRLLNILDEKGLDKNTIVIFSSDNGPEWPGVNFRANTYWSRGSTAGLRGQKRSLFQGGVNVPFIIRWPGISPAGRVDTASLLSTIDLYPTFCAIAGAEIPEGWNPDGENILNAFKGRYFNRTKPLFWEYKFCNPGHHDLWPDLAVRQGDWKLLKNYKMDKAELFNIAADRFEKNDLLKQYPEKAKELEGLLLGWKARLP